MEAAIQVIWWIGLLGALAATLVILKQVALILRLLRDIDQLARITRKAARGLASHLEADVQVTEPTQALQKPIKRMAAAVAAIDRRLAVFTGEAPSGRG